MYRRFFSITACLLFSTNLAQAASHTNQDPHPSEELWTGFYAGIYAGYAWSRSTGTLSTAPSYTANTNSYWSSATANQINASGVFKLDSNGSTDGIQLGYNQRFSNNALVGLETDIGAFTLIQNKSTITGYIQYPTASYTISQKIKTSWLYTLRPRLGYTFSKTLLFATGGLSLTDFQYTETFSDDVYDVGGSPPGANAYQSVSKNRATFGWNVGAGIEYLIEENLSISLSYLYTGFCNTTTNAYVIVQDAGPYYINPINGKATLSANIMRLGMNWHF